MKTVKLLFFMLLACSFSFLSCSSDDDGDGGDSKAKEEIKKQVEEITSTLEDNDDLSTFAEAFKALDVNSVPTKELTVFAFKNEAMESALKSDTDLPQDILKRHIAEGSYDLAGLKKLKQLSALSGDKLSVVDSSGVVYVNGVSLGNPTKVSNSTVFVINQMLPVAAKVDSTQNNARIQVLECNTNWSPENSDEGFPAEGALVKIYRSDKSLYQTLKTDEFGEVVFTWNKGMSLYYSVERGDSKNLYKGYVIGGLFTSQQQMDSYSGDYPAGEKALGKLTFADLNGDGVINASDKVTGYSSLPSGNNTFSVYIASEQFSTAPSLAAIESLYGMACTRYVRIDNSLYTQSAREKVNASDTLLTAYWYNSYQVIDGVRLFMEAQGTPSPSDVAKARMYRAHMYSLLMMPFGDLPMIEKNVFPPRSSMEEVAQFVMSELDAAIPNLPQKGSLVSKTDALRLKGIVLMQLAGVLSQQGNYQSAANVFKEIIDGNTVLDPYVNLFYIEAKNEYEGTSSLAEMQNMLNSAYILAEVEQTAPSLTGMNQEQVRTAIKTAFEVFGEYSYKMLNVTRWGENAGWGKYKLLPIPQRAMNETGSNLTQNPGW